MTTMRLSSIVLAAALISSCSSGSNTPGASPSISDTSPSTPEASVSPSIIPSPSMTSPVAQQGLDLDPVPFFFAPLDAMNLPDWMPQLSTVQMPADAAAYNASVGILAVVSVYYNANNGGDPVPVFSVQYMPENVYTDFQNMDGPQEVGNQVFSSDGNVVAVFGPQDYLFEPGSIDQQIVDEILQAAYNPESYEPKIN
jgi:hypothetical protein